MRTGFASVACLLLWCGAASAQPTTARNPNPFRADIEAVEVDVRVLDAQGRPVPGLTREDFELFDEGVRQEIRTFTSVDVPSAPPARSVAIEPDVQSNRHAFDGRLYMLVLDDLHTTPLQTNRVKRAVRRFLDDYLAANDRAAIVVTSGRTDGSQELTVSRQALLTALDRFQGRKLRSSTLERLDQYYMNRDILERRNDGRPERIDDPLEHERGYNARVALDTLAAAAKWLGGVPARRKALLFFSEGIDYDIHDAIENKEASTILASAHNAIATATRGNVTIYGIDPRGLTLDGGDGIDVASLPDDPSLNLGTTSLANEVRLAQDSLRRVSDETGGFAIVNANDLSASFSRIRDENSHYYLLGYQPSTPRRDGKFHRLEVRVRRPGLRVVARRGYVDPKAETRRAEANEDRAPDLRALLDSPVPVPGLALDSTVAVFRGASGKASALVTLEVGPGITLKEVDGAHRGRVDVSVLALGADGKATGGDQRAIELKLKPDTLPRVSQHGFRTLSRLDLAPGRYQLRIAAREQGSDHGGSVIHDLVVPDFAATPVAVSHVLLASRAATQALTTKPDAELKDRLPLPPTALRDFDRRDVITAFAEVYDNRSGALEPVTLTTSVLTQSGTPAFRSEENVEPFSFEPKRHSWTHRVEIPLKDLSPGAYVLRIEAKPRNSASSAVYREVPFSVRPDRRTTSELVEIKPLAGLDRGEVMQ